MFNSFLNRLYKKDFNKALKILREMINNNSWHNIKGNLKRIISQEEPIIKINSKEIIGISSSGGSTIPTFNVGVVASFIACGAGLTIVKTGSSKISSPSGATDALIEWGVNIDMNKRAIIAAIKNIGITFINSEKFCPWVGFAKYVKKENNDLDDVKKILDYIFFIRSSKEVNFFAKINGIKSPKVKERAEILKNSGLKRAIVVHGMSKYKDKFIDEFSICGKNIVAEIMDNNIKVKEIYPEDVGINRCKIEDIELKDLSSKKIINVGLKILKNKLKDSPLEKLALVNAMLAIFLIKGKNYKESYQEAKTILRKGLAYEKLKDLICHSNNYAE